ncbi:DUF4012 domain-containing protein [Candidatus Nomurabacteria bacterium]|nr:DUF4012 domain-containing protein [Candidatus Nomurabacteria bacterium]
MKKGVKIFLIIIGIVISFFALLAISLVLIFFYFKGAFSGGNLDGFFLRNSFIQNKIVEVIGEDKRDLVELSPSLLGLEQPMTYLVLFLNNTELRPGGGFIGSYAIIRLDQGNVSVLTVEGTENLDGRSPESWNIQPPKYLQAPLGVDRWYFRDSNWSIDFPTNAQRALEFYKGEGGEYAESIDAVIAFTPTVLEKVLTLTGPIHVDGIEFTSENVVETLEYEVEYGYEKHGIQFEQRKAIMGRLLTEIQTEMKGHFVEDVGEYLGTFEDMLVQKHILMYFKSDEIQAVMEQHNYDGRVIVGGGDYFLWADANLSALKTDHALERELVYTISKEEGKYIGRVTMNYTHTGSFDWRTSRYRTFARIFVPQGSKLIEVQGGKPWAQVRDLGKSFIGQELGLTWFGVYAEFEPQTDHRVTFVFELSDDIVADIESGDYHLKVQKQLGTVDHSLTLDLNFDKNVVQAHPAEEQKFWGDDRYQVWTGLGIDREFSVKIENE